jgi:D-tyrosyl-tRNA(Tyr) deacylase
MKVVAQRVLESNVKVDGKVVGEIGKGLMLLVSFTQTDTVNEIDYMVNKVSNLRIFDDENGIMNLSIKDIGGEVLSISQFTLYGDARKGNRPSYVAALNGEEAIKLYDLFNEKLNEIVHVEKGIFGADMKVSLINDGPVTILLEK